MQLLIESVSKRYKGDLWALKNFSLKLGPGVLGLLGPNGAGKTTLMNILSTITRPTEGTVKWNGTDISQQPGALRAVLGYLPQDFGVYPNLNPVEFLEYLAAVKGLWRSAARKRIDELLDLVNLREARKRPLGGFSGGMKQRVGIAQALLNDPHLLIVDEPTAGLDPEERIRFRSLLSELSGERIVILSTHIVSDVEVVATEIALIASGSLVQHTTPERLLGMVEGKVWEWIIPSAELPVARKSYLISSTLHRGDGVHARVVADSAPNGAVPVFIEPQHNFPRIYSNRQSSTFPASACSPVLTSWNARGALSDSVKRLAHRRRSQNPSDSCLLISLYSIFNNVEAKKGYEDDAHQLH